MDGKESVRVRCKMQNRKNGISNVDCRLSIANAGYGVVGRITRSQHAVVNLYSPG